MKITAPIAKEKQEEIQLLIEEIRSKQVSPLEGMSESIQAILDDLVGIEDVNTVATIKLTEALTHASANEKIFTLKKLESAMIRIAIIS